MEQRDEQPAPVIQTRRTAWPKGQIPPPLREHVFKPGQSGNPSGLPKRTPILELYEDALKRAAKAMGKPEDVDPWVLFGDMLVLATLQDRVPSIIHGLIDRRDGPVVQKQEIQHGVLDILKKEHARWLKRGELPTGELPSGAEHAEFGAGVVDETHVDPERAELPEVQRDDGASLTDEGGAGGVAAGGEAVGGAGDLA